MFSDLNNKCRGQNGFYKESDLQNWAQENLVNFAIDPKFAASNCISVFHYSATHIRAVVHIGDNFSILCIC